MQIDPSLEAKMDEYFKKAVKNANPTDEVSVLINLDVSDLSNLDLSGLSRKERKELILKKRKPEVEPVKKKIRELSLRAEFKSYFSILIVKGEIQNILKLADLPEVKMIFLDRVVKAILAEDTKGQ